MVNELKGGWQWSPLDFSSNARRRCSRSRADSPGPSQQRREHAGMTTPGNLNGLEIRNTTNWNIDNAELAEGQSHSFGFGTSFMQINHVRIG